MIAYVQRVLSDEEATSPAAVSSTTSSDSDSEDDEDEELTTEDDENEHLKNARGTGMRQVSTHKGARKTSISIYIRRDVRK